MAAGYSNDEILGSYTIEDRFSEYFDLIRPEWWQNFAGAIEKARGIRDAGNDLLVQWRSATRVADFPATMMVMFNQFADTTLKSQMPSDMAPMLAEAWGKAFRAHAPKLADGTLFNTAIRATSMGRSHRLSVAFKVMNWHVCHQDGQEGQGNNRKHPGDEKRKVQSSSYCRPLG